MFGEHEFAVVQGSDVVEDGGREGQDAAAGAVDVGTAAVSQIVPSASQSQLPIVSWGVCTRVATFFFSRLNPSTSPVILDLLPQSGWSDSDNPPTVNGPSYLRASAKRELRRISS